MSDELMPEDIASTDDLISIGRKLGKSFLKNESEGSIELAGLLLGSADRLELQKQKLEKVKKILKGNNTNAHVLAALRELEK